MKTYATNPRGEYNPRFVNYARVHGRSPDDMPSDYSFIEWVRERWAEWKSLDDNRQYCIGHNVGSEGHRLFDEWLDKWTPPEPVDHIVLFHDPELNDPRQHGFASNSPCIYGLMTKSDAEAFGRRLAERCAANDDWCDDVETIEDDHIEVRRITPLPKWFTDGECCDGRGCANCRPAPDREV